MEYLTSTYYLGQNFPNPFNPTTKIDYEIAQSGIVELKVYDVLGREVVNILVNEFQNPGKYQVNFDGK